ncbi:hypothetical protein AB0N65_20325 [Paenarthrobacter sp. NPDC089322]|uniref:COG1470 family protein n=1 Tax=Paenarthrobacter sp. NPDC089322 TaxID=3155065 RepID=UPI00342A1357
MDHRPERTTPFHRAAVPLRALLLAIMVALVPVTALAASGQGGQAGAAKVKGITVSLSPSSRSVDQGQGASYTVSATSTNGFAGMVTFAVEGLPVGAAAAWSPSSVVLASGSTKQVTLSVSTSPTTPAGKANLTVKASSGSIQSQAVAAQLHVQEVKRTFTVSGSVDGLLAPGVSRPLNLQISNPAGKNIGVTNLTVAVSGVVRTPAAVAANLPCTPADYQLTQYTGTYPLTAPSGASSLSSLGVPQTKWPQVRMLDTPQLQDGCKGAALHLTYTGTGQAD